MQPLTLCVRSHFKKAFFLVGLFFLTSCSQSPVTSEQLYDGLYSAIEEQGQVAILLNLAGDWIPEGELTDSQRTLQREQIASVQDQIIADLADYNVRNIKKMITLPILGVTVDGEALSFLAEHSLVASIEEDTPEGPFEN